MLLFILSLLTFFAVFTLAYAIFSPAEDLKERLEAYSYNFTSVEEMELAQPFRERIILPALNSISKMVTRFMPSTIFEKTKENLILAGSPPNLTVSNVLAVRGIAIVSFPALYAIMVLASRSAIGPLQLMIFIVLTYVGNKAPDMYLQMKVKSRQQAIQKALPDAIDLISVTVEAGLALEAALTRVSERIKGPLAEEIRRALMESAMGRPRRDALHDIGRRTGVSDLISFIATITQADQIGASISQVLKVQSEAMRVRRRQRAQEQGMQAPLKMLLPLIFCILPATFVVVLGPAAIGVWEAMVNSGA